MTETKATYKRDEIDSLFFTPAELGTNLVKYAESVKAGEGITWGVASIDKYVLPLRAGKIIGIMARQGNGKSTLAGYLAQRTARLIRDAGDDKGIVVYVTSDQPVEEIEAILQAPEGVSVTDIAWGRVDVEKLRVQALRRVTLPLWIMGKSVTERRVSQRMTLQNVYKAIGEIERRYGKKPRLVVLDYIQNFPKEGWAVNRSEEVTDAIRAARELCLDLQVPLVICVQAGRSVDIRDDKIPQPRDCQHASAIEQEADALLGIWRPVLTEGEGSTMTFEVNGKEYELKVTQSLFVAMLTKQRMSPAGQRFVLHFDPGLVKLSDMELDGAEQNWSAK